MTRRQRRLYVALLVVAFFAVVVGVEWAAQHLTAGVSVERENR